MNNDWREYSYYDLDYLAHHGILGQKWGIRRFENANGHLTPAGLKRYEDGRKVTSKEKNAFSVKAAGHKALAKVYGVNEKFYSKNNKALSSMNKAAKNQQLKKAEQAQKEANEKQAAKQNDPEAAARRKKMIVAGAAVAGTALAAYGGYKLYQLNKNQKSDKLSSQKQLEKVQQQYAKDKMKWNQQTSKLEFQKKQAERYGDTKTAARIDKKLASSPPPLPTSHSKEGVEATNKLASEASALARSVVMTGPMKTSKPAQNTSKSTSTASKASTSYSSGKKTVSNITKISGQQKFSQAAKANDDYVSQMLKRNGSSLSNFSMSDLSKLDLY